MLLAIALIPAVTWAGGSPVAAGNVEYSPSIAFSRSAYTPAGGGASTSMTHLDLTGAVGRCMSDRFEIMGALLVQHRDQAGTGRNGIGASAGVGVNFAAYGNVFPFVSGSVGVLRYSNPGSSDRTMLAPILRAGIRTLIMEGRSVNVSIGYQHEVNPKSIINKGADAFDVGVGMSIFRAPTD
jgi:hypothetical protein